MRVLLFLSLLVFIQGSKLPVQYVSDNEILVLSEEMWLLDRNRMDDGDYKINPNGPKLITDVNEAKIQKGTYGMMVPLFSNYNPVIGVEEKECSDCRKQERDFLTDVLDSNLMQKLWKFLESKDLASSHEQGFRDQLNNYWFNRYSRSQGKALDSSGFEHVFAGELKSNEASGFHNWVQFYLQEKEGDLEYSHRISNCEPNLYLTSFYWHGKYKRIGSLFIGTSPEYELGIYTLCFLTRPNAKCTISADGNERFITTYSMNNVKPLSVGTAYPDCV